MRIGNDPLSDAIPAGWAPVLKDDWAIADYIDGISPGYVDREFIRECFRFGVATLRMVPIDELTPGPADANVRVASRERKYAKMDPATMPPLVVQDGQIQDGGHRYRVAKAKGLAELPCYVVEYPED